MTQLAKKISELKRKIFKSSRNLIQLMIFIFTVSIGFQFYLFVMQVNSGQKITIPRPEGVEAFLPIGALMGWKYYLTTGIWDVIHPASMVFLLFAVLISFLFRKAFCSWFCPVGTLSEWVWKSGLIIYGRNYLLPKWIDLPLRGVKYLLLAFFVYIIFKMDSAGIKSFLESPYYKIADVKMLHFFTKMTAITALILIVLSFLSLFFRNFWCRYICPYGALLGIFAMFSPVKVKRNTKSCTNCGNCNKVCPFHLPVDKKLQITSPLCSGCTDCIESCPSKKTLELKSFGIRKTLKTKSIGIWILIIFCMTIYIATISGHFNSSLSINEYKMWIKITDSEKIKHPSTF